MSNNSLSLDTNWLWAVLQYAKQHPDLFPEPAKNTYVLHEHDVPLIAMLIDGKQ